MKNRFLFPILLIILLLTACSKGGETNHQPMNNQIPTNIYISIYKTDSTNVQPELIDMIGDHKLLKQFYIWKEDGIQTSLPSHEKVDRIYILQYSYEGADPKSEYYMYVTDKDGNYYLNQFDYNDSYESYQASLDKEGILNKIGSEDWHEVSSIEMVSK
ncbi:hypothetical protein [Paenibacillus sp. FSL R7-0331]|uniref:hypothetical protein n=1 Tax=Paenibacillus sp. FSL R7-0331 TaxID=1536773 RepID=UPI0004F90E0A|nr:hypothetical protein [Paenibacillus sp. FSL R7-0331]AIQ53417.1 hypothetical protein R70331_19000 [Paenibacillus sp. FSL R7-0331]